MYDKEEPSAIIKELVQNINDRRKQEEVLGEALHTITTPGLPENYVAISYRPALPGELVFYDRKVIKVLLGDPNKSYLIVREIEQRSITIKKTTAKRQVNYGEYYKSHTGLIGQWASEHPSDGEYEIWTVVEEVENDQLG